ncbi:MAG: 4Fe-4S dicluster domain-containing protein [Bacteroidales bacterium]
MGKLFDRLMEDNRMQAGFHSCINCGTCTAICPAAEFYKYNPQTIVSTVQTRNDDEIEKLLKGNQIWYCGSCMSCLQRCPRKNAPGLIVMALRKLSVDTGFFVCSEKGRQEYALMKILCNNILEFGYCIYPETFKYEDHPEYGPVGQWVLNNADDVYERVGAPYKKDTVGALRKIPKESIDDLKKIFDISGATAQMKQVKDRSMEQAKKMGMSEEEYFDMCFRYSSDIHFNNKDD